ncbi:hypothetical protein L5G32_17975 [Gordonia sp. HY002]|uniref:hypothetical protein n=1 Tax=Gordonia zhenghanii TaxID=2911516 RepID=UPI001EEFE3B8|nr:hypothetical protein [Gordonia zhenghanii]MCF8572151.1 hypothetical protein [Gordonia zhenghanii]MCF8604265.1 hypothetical protein [Gordonia zhenghanii]
MIPKLIPKKIPVPPLDLPGPDKSNPDSDTENDAELEKDLRELQDLLDRIEQQMREGQPWWPNHLSPRDLEDEIGRQHGYATDLEDRLDSIDDENLKQWGKKEVLDRYRQYLEELWDHEHQQPGDRGSPGGQHCHRHRTTGRPGD